MPFMLGRPTRRRTASTEEARAHLHAVFNAEYHADRRAENHTYVNRDCLLSTIKGILVPLERRVAVLEEQDNFSALDEYQDLAKRITQLKKDAATLQQDKEEHFPHYAFVHLCSAFIDGMGFVPKLYPDYTQGELHIPHIETTVGTFAAALRDRLVADAASFADKLQALEHMVANLRSDADRANDSFDRLIPVGDIARDQQLKNPDALYAVLIQPPPQTGSAAIRGETPSEPPTEPPTDPPTE